MGTSVYTGVFAVCGLVVTVSVSVCGSLASRVSPHRQVRVGLIALLGIDLVFAAVCLLLLAGPVSQASRAGLTVLTVALFILHVAAIGACIGNLPALALGRAGRWAGTASALLGFIQFVAGGVASPLVGLTGSASGVAFGVTVVVIGVLVNVLAAFGLRAEGDKEREAAARAEREAHRLGR